MQSSVRVRCCGESGDVEDGVSDGRLRSTTRESMLP